MKLQVWLTRNREISWIDCLMNFSRLLSTAPKPRNAGPVKIAIIDSGVDASLAALQGRIAAGRSFARYNKSTSFMQPYFISSNGHGTYMAMVICNICPEASLYIARLDEESGEGGERISIRSAADVSLSFGGFPPTHDIGYIS